MYTEKNGYWDTMFVTFNYVTNITNIKNFNNFRYWKKDKNFELNYSLNPKQWKTTISNVISLPHIILTISIWDTEFDYLRY